MLQLKLSQFQSFQILTDRPIAVKGEYMYLERGHNSELNFTEGPLS